MTVAIPQVDTSNTSTDTFGSTIDKLNQVINALSTQIVTANTNANGSLTTGNAYGNGIFTFNVLTSDGYLRGGNVQAAANLSIQSNATVGNSSANVFLGYGQINVSGIFSVNSSILGMGANVSLNTSTLGIGNSTINVSINSSLLSYGGNLQINSTALQIGNSTVNAILNSSSLLVGANVTLGTASLSIGNSTVNAYVNSTTSVVGTALATTVNTATLTMGNSTVNVLANSISIILSGNLQVNSTTIQIGNSTINTTANASVVATGTGNFSTGANVGSNVNLTTAGLSVGNSTVNTSANSTVLATGTGNFSVGANVGANVKLTTTGLSVGNSTVNTQINSSAVVVGGSAVVTAATRSAVDINGTGYVDNTINFISGSGISVAASHDVTDGFINVTITATGGFTGAANDLVVANTVTIGNSTINTFANSTLLNIFTANVAVQVGVGANVILSNTGFSIGNSTINTTANSSVVNTGTGSFSINALVGANVSINTSAVGVGNSTVNVTINSSSVFIGSAVQLGNTAIAIGNSTVNTSINSTSIDTTTLLLGVANAAMSYFTFTTTGTSQQVIDQFTLATYRGGRYTMSVKDNTANGYQMADVLVMHDGTTALFTEYAILTTNASLGSISAIVTGANVQMIFTPTSANNTVQGTRTLITV